MRRHPGFLTSFAASVSSTLWQHNNSPVACSVRSASTNTTSTKRRKLSHAASASGTTPSSPPATTVAPSSVNVPLKTDDGASQIMTDNQPLPTQKSEETPKAVDLSQILARCLAHLVLPHGGRAVSGAALPSASQHRGAALTVAVILCTWPSNTTLGDKRIILRDLSSGARLTTTSTALHSTYTPWFEQLYPPTGASATPVCSVWLVPNFATENGVAIQAFLRDGVQRRADLSNDAMIKKRNTKTTASSTSSPPDDSSVATAIRKLLPEGHRVVISMRQLISNSRTPSSVNSNWHLRTEDNCIDLLTFATTHWTIADWEAFTPNNSVLSTWSTQNTTVPKKISNSKQQLSTTSAASLPQRKGTVAPLTATTAPAVTSMPQQSAAKASTPLASPPTTAAAAAGRAAASLSPEVIKIYEEISAIVGAATGHHSAQRHIDVYVVSTLRGALHVCPFGQTTAVPAETLLDTLKRGKGGGATMVVSPVFLATSEQSLELLKEKALLQHNTFTAAAATTPSTTTTTTTASIVHHYTPFVLRLCDVEYSVHRAKLGNKPAEATAAPPPTTNTTNAAGVAPLTDWNRFKIDRQYLFKAIGVVRLLDIARSHTKKKCAATKRKLSGLMLLASCATYVWKRITRHAVRVG
ncbi:unnamed protein product [Bodo saltans]|uniref:Uncharacterized protein n=1 Tax=Bodo saltans TaxID=75058 RepID=A0A0S4J2J5_BODSA|nr:unnamed protein product [Bodo saltans]|eukprot:CUG84893.1 unnamed protein product [Bodo saltans]